MQLLHGVIFELLVLEVLFDASLLGLLYPLAGLPAAGEGFSSAALLLGDALLRLATLT